MLTKSTIKRLLDALEDSYFTTAGFSIEFPEEGEIYALIKFRDNPEYLFRFSHKNYTHSYTVSYQPGTILKSTVYSTDKLSEVLKSVGVWTESIKEELRTLNPFFDEMKDLRKEFNEKLDAAIEDGKSQFTKEELDALKDKFDDLNEKFTELHIKNEVTEEELEKVKRTLDELTQDAKSFPKKVWYRTAGAKFIKLTSKVLSSKQGQTLLDHGADKLIEAIDKTT